MSVTQYYKTSELRARRKAEVARLIEVADTKEHIFNMCLIALLVACGVAGAIAGMVTS